MINLTLENLHRNKFDTNMNLEREKANTCISLLVFL